VLLAGCCTWLLYSAIMTIDQPMDGPTFAEGSCGVEAAGFDPDPLDANYLQADQPGLFAIFYGSF
jgi:hypothetical protein